MTTERMEVERTIEAEPAAVFDVLRDPQGQVSIDASGMLIDATVNMDFPPEEQYGGDRYPPSVMPSKEDWAAVEKRWKEFGFK